MRSRFTAFFVLTRSLLAIVPVAFLIIPVAVYFSSDKGYENQSSLVPCIIMTIVMWPLVYLFAKEYNIITITLSPEGIRVEDILTRKKRTYPYSHVVKTDIEVRRTIGYTGRSGMGRRDINDNPVYLIYMQNGDSVVLASDVYANSGELYNFINERKLALMQNE